MGHTCAYTHALCIVGASLNLDLVKIQLLCIQESPWGKWSKKVIGEITVELACYGVQVHLILGNILSHIISQGPMEAQTQCGADSNTCLDFSKSKLLMELWWSLLAQVHKRWRQFICFLILTKSKWLKVNTEGANSCSWRNFRNKLILAQIQKLTRVS